MEKRIEAEGHESLSNEERDCYQPFLLALKENDYVVYINVPKFGECTLAQVTGEYQWKWDEKKRDFSHRFPVDPKSVRSFNRNGRDVPSALSARLKLMGRWWKIYAEREFRVLLKVLDGVPRSGNKTPEDRLEDMSKDMQPLLSEATKIVQRHHPNFSLEDLLYKVFKEVPGVKRVEKRKGKADFGADIIVEFEFGSISDLTETILVQVKSYTGEHNTASAADDIRRAFEHHSNATMGLIVSTAESAGKDLTEELDRVREHFEKPVALLLGTDLAKFLLKYEAALLQ